LKQPKITLHLLINLGYLVLTIILTWPLTSQLTTHIPGEATWAFDESTFIWNMWWLKHTVLVLQQNPLHTTYTFFPLGVDLTTYTFNLFNAAFGLPLQLALSLPLANNLTLIFSYVSSAYGMFLLSLYLIRREANVEHHSPSSPKLSILSTTPNFLTPYFAAFLAGAVYAFSASRMMYVALGHYNFVTIQWFPYYVLLLLVTLRVGGLIPIILTAIFASLCLYAELTYSVFILFLTLIILLHEIAHQRKLDGQVYTIWHPLKQLIPRLAVVVCLTFFLTAPFILAVLPNFLDPAYAEPGWGEGLKLSADLVGLVTLTPLHPLSGLDWIQELRDVIEGKSRFSDANTLFLGYGILIMALLGTLIRWPATRPWLWSVIFFTILSLGPLLTINGQNRFDLDGIEATFPLPFAGLHYIPLISANRVPNRFGIIVTLALAVLIGYAVYWLLKHLTTYLTTKSPKFSYPLSIIVSLFLLIFLLADQFSVPIPLTSAEIPTVYQQIGQESEMFTLMQLPLGWRNSYGTLGAERTQLQYYQAAHQRPMLGGNTSRNPAFKFDYYRNIPLFYAITQAELYQSVDEEIVNRARQQATALMTLYNIKYLVIHDPLPFRKPYEDTYFETQKLALDLIPHENTPIYQSPGVRAYAVQQAEIPAPFLIDFGDWTSDPYRGAGWAGNETVFSATANWITAPEATLFFPVRDKGERTLTMQIAPFHYPSAPPQQVTFLLNEQPLPDTIPLAEGWQTISLTLPPEMLQNGLNNLTLQFAHTASPRDVIPTPLLIGETGLTTPIDLELNSGAGFAFITVGFDETQRDASSHRRGINVAVIDSQSGQIIAKQGFDTAANEYEASALSQFLTQIETGQIVLIATLGDTALAYLTPEAITNLQSIGLTPELLNPPFSAIGVKGATHGTALYAQGEGTAYLRVGRVPDTRTLAGAVDWVRIE